MPARPARNFPNITRSMRPATSRPGSASMAGESTSDIVRVQPESLRPPGGHYSHATVANGFVFVSGQLPIAADGTRLVDAPFEAQARQVLDNLRTVLEAAGSGIDRLVQVRI